MRILGLLIFLCVAVPVGCDYGRPCVPGAPGATVEILYDVERVGDAGVVERDCEYTVTTRQLKFGEDETPSYTEQLSCHDVGFACSCSGMYRRDTSGAYEVTVTNRNGNSVVRELWIPSACYEHEVAWRFTFPMDVPPASVEDAITLNCRNQAVCYGETFQECLSSRINIRSVEVEHGCDATWDALTMCEAQHPHNCDEIYSSYCLSQVIDHQRCGFAECGGIGYSPPSAAPIPCAYRCMGAGAECTGDTEGDIHCTCTEGPHAQHAFDVYDCNEFFTRYGDECVSTESPDASSP